MRTRRFTRFSLSVLALSAASLMLIDSAAAQGSGLNANGFGTAIRGVPPSVTSFGFGGQPGFHGVPPSVTSLGFGNAPFQINQPPVFLGRQHHRNNPGFNNPGLVSPFFGNVVAVPYAYPVYVIEPGPDDSMEQDYRGGPTIFDRRGQGMQEYATPEPRETQRSKDGIDNSEDYRASSNPEPAAQQEVAEQPRTVLVFKDGRVLEIANYAIVGATLYDLSEGRARRIALAELDLPSTVKQNGERGVDFVLPATSVVN